MAHLGFDATQVPPDSGQLDPVPAGWYNVAADESELKPTADGLGARLAVRFNILDGQFANRKIYTGFNLRNANPVAQEIAFKQLSAFAHAVGVLQVQDSQQLHGIPLKVRVKIQPPKDGYEAKNEITAFKNFNENVGGAASGAPAAIPPTGPTVPPPAVAPVAPGAWSAAPAQPWPQPTAAPVVPPVAAPPTAAPPTAAPPTAAPPPPSHPTVIAPPQPPAFPPAGWTAHPQAPGYFYQGQEVLSEAELRAKASQSVSSDPAAEAKVAIPPWCTPQQQ